MVKVQLSGRPICITGASSGIGRATAVACARAGMPVVVSARRTDRLEALVGEIERGGGRAMATALDVNDQDACREMVAKCIERFGSVYAVFANAGYGVEEAMHSMDEGRLRAMFETNFFGTMNALWPAIPPMLEQRAGHLLICSSCLARFPVPYFGAYSATKAAQHHIGRAMNVELRRSGVRVTTVHPVGTRTEFFDTAKTLSPGDGRSLDGHAPKIFTQTPETVARSIVKCLRRPRPEVWPSWSWIVRVGMGLGSIFPGLSDLGVRRIANTYLDEEPVGENPSPAPAPDERAAPGQA